MAEGLEPYAEEWLKAEEMQGGRFVFHGTVEEQRAQFAGFIESIRPFLPPPSEKIKIVDAVVPKSGQKIRIYIPVGIEGPIPIGLYIHSGGWYMGSIEHEDHLCREILARVPIILFSPEYRLAPEHPFPAGLEDCYAAYEWMHANAATYTASPTPSKSLVMGGSAGGNLAGAVALHYSTHSTLKPAGLIMAVPAITIDPRALPAEYASQFHPERYTDTPLLTRASMTKAAEMYASPHPTHPDYSLLLHPSLAHLPPTALLACTNDPTYDETLIFHDALTKAGVSASLEVFHGYPHFFWIIPGLEGTGRFLDMWGVKVREMIGG